jgi:hypothetical protein
VAIRKMDQTVATQNHVDAWKFVASQIEQEKFSLIVAVEFAVTRDEIRDDVRADVLFRLRAVCLSSS